MFTANKNSKTYLLPFSVNFANRMLLHDDEDFHGLVIFTSKSSLHQWKYEHLQGAYIGLRKSLREDPSDLRRIKPVVHYINYYRPTDQHMKRSDISIRFIPCYEWWLYCSLKIKTVSVAISLDVSFVIVIQLIKILQSQKTPKFCLKYICFDGMRQAVVKS